MIYTKETISPHVPLAINFRVRSRTTTTTTSSYEQKLHHLMPEFHAVIMHVLL